MQMQSRIDSIFNRRAFDRPLFYSFTGGLRFELSEGGAPLDQVLTALRKANAICEDIFSGAELITVCLRNYVWSNQFAFRNCLRELRLAGISIGLDRSICLSTLPCPAGIKDGSDETYVTVAFELPKTRLQNILWCAFSGDFPSLRPNPQCQIYLFNMDRCVIAHPYDDRGMDVVGLDKDLLQELYIRHNALLLDYDRAAMDATFKSDNLGGEQRL